MGSRKGKVRFGIGEGSSLYSEIWTLWHNKSDVYLTSKSFGGRVKLSLHQSGVCQYAFTQDFFQANEGVFQSGFKDRTWHRWKRDHVEQNSAVHAVSIVFASSEDWHEYEAVTDESAVLLPKPPHGYCFEISVILLPSSYSDFMPDDPARPFAEFALPNDQVVAVFAGFNELPADYWDFKKVEGNIVEFGDSIARADDPNDVKGISILRFTQEIGGPFVIHSSHNMRLIRLPIGAPIPVYKRPRSWMENLRLFFFRWSPRS